MADSLTGRPPLPPSSEIFTLIFSVKRDHGVLVTDGPGGNRHKRADSSKCLTIYNMSTFNPKLCQDNVGDTIPVMADILLAFATVPGTAIHFDSHVFHSVTPLDCTLRNCSLIMTRGVGD